MTDPAQTNGPRQDGSQSLATESRRGQATTFVLSTLALGAAGWLGDLDLSTLPGWAAGVAAVAVSGLVGTLVAWGTKNRRDYFGKPFGPA